jgi:hypothetical protein
VSGTSSVVRSHMAEIVSGLPLEMGQAFQAAAKTLPWLMEQVIADSSFGVVQVLVTNGFPELGQEVAGVIQRNIWEHGRPISS